MGGKSDSGRPERRRIGAAAKEIFLAALRAGLKRDEAAAQAGFTSEAFYYARRRDRVFRTGAMTGLSAEASAKAGAEPADGR